MNSRQWFRLILPSILFLASLHETRAQAISRGAGSGSTSIGVAGAATTAGGLPTLTNAPAGLSGVNLLPGAGLVAPLQPAANPPVAIEAVPAASPLETPAFPQAVKAGEVLRRMDSELGRDMGRGDLDAADSTLKKAYDQGGGSSDGIPPGGSGDGGFSGGSGPRDFMSKIGKIQIELANAMAQDFRQKRSAAWRRKGEKLRQEITAKGINEHDVDQATFRELQYADFRWDVLIALRSYTAWLATRAWRERARRLPVPDEFLIGFPELDDRSRELLAREYGADEKVLKAVVRYVARHNVDLPVIGQVLRGEVIVVRDSDLRAWAGLYGWSDDSPESGLKIGFSQSIPAKHQATLNEAFALHEGQVAEFMRALGLASEQLHGKYFLVTASRDESPGAATVVRFVSYKISVYASQFDTGLAIANFEALVNLRTKALSLRQASKSAASVGALPPDATRGWIKELTDYLAAKGIAAEVGLIADTPSGFASGPNVVSVRVPPTGRGALEDRRRIGAVYDALEEAGKPFQDQPLFPWLPSTWELGIKGRSAYRTAIPFEGRRLTQKEAAKVLGRFGAGTVTTYQAIQSMPPFPGALEIRPIAADQLLANVASLSLYERPGVGAKTERDYYAVWTGKPVGPALAK